jgi:hypothetical protein
MRLYIFVDADYGRNRSAFKAFEPSLFVWATVTSRPTEDRVIVVAGLKTLPPSIRGRRWFAASPPRPTSARLTSMEDWAPRAPPTGSAAATRSG